MHALGFKQGTPAPHTSAPSLIPGKHVNVAVLPFPQGHMQMFDQASGHHVAGSNPTLLPVPVHSWFATITLSVHLFPGLWQSHLSTILQKSCLKSINASAPPRKQQPQQHRASLLLNYSTPQHRLALQYLQTSWPAARDLSHHLPTREPANACHATTPSEPLLA
jgi:hypothetical protein